MPQALQQVVSPNLGKRAKDTLTGYEGTVVAHAIHATGCDQIALGGKLDKDGDPAQAQWFDIHRVELLDGEVWQPVMAQTEARTGACATPPRVH